jgi:hypothetical protein
MENERTKRFMKIWELLQDIDAKTETELKNAIFELKVLLGESLHSWFNEAEQEEILSFARERSI